MSTQTITIDQTIIEEDIIQQIVAYTLDEMGEFKRGDIRYALFRCQKGNPEPMHRKMFEFYRHFFDDYGLRLFDFADKWDLHKEDPRDIVSGHQVHLYKKQADADFNKDRKIKVN